MVVDLRTQRKRDDWQVSHERMQRAHECLGRGRVD
jgi:hypothetical protein